MINEFRNALAAVLIHEGGKADDPHDPGGKTNQGITQGTFTAFLHTIGKPSRDVFTMTDDERDTIYNIQYWDTVWGDRQPPGLGYVLFDGAVNSGVKRSVKWLQISLGEKYVIGEIDGIMGLHTLSATMRHPDHRALIYGICFHRLKFLQSLKTFPRFGKGWARRVEEVQHTGQAWARGETGPTILWQGDGTQAKGYRARAVRGRE
jgi:lysozyme family protein